MSLEKYIGPTTISRFLNVRENMHTSKITDKKDSYTQNASFITCEIGHFHKSAKIYTRKNIYVHSISLRMSHVIVRNIVRHNCKLVTSNYVGPVRFM